MIDSGVNHGWQIRDAHENDQENGGDQSFASRETPQDPPEVSLPELKLRYVAEATPPPTPPTMDPGTLPTAVHCGQVLTQDTIVANDLDNCPAEGLVVGASNIVVDLNGHTIDGPDYLIENTTGQEEGFPAGIRISGRTNVIVRNGTVRQFGWGVLLSSATTHSVVDNLDSTGHAVAGVELFDADDGRSGNTIQNSTIADNELGLLLGAGSENSVVRNNDIHGNLGEQVFIHLSDGHRIENNTMHGIPSDPQLDSDGGVLLEGASDNVLVDNTVHDTGDAGINIHMGSHRNRVEGGTYYRNGDAGVIINDSDRNKVIDITSHQQSDGGVVLGNAHDTEVRDSDLRFNPSGVEASNTNLLIVYKTTPPTACRPGSRSATASASASSTTSSTAPAAPASAWRAARSTPSGSRSAARSSRTTGRTRTARAESWSPTAGTPSAATRLTTTPALESTPARTRRSLVTRSRAPTSTAAETRRAATPSPNNARGLFATRARHRRSSRRT